VSPNRSPRPVLRRAVPALAAFAVIVAVAAAALQTGRSNLATAELDRLRDRAAMIERLAGNIADQSDPHRDEPRIASTPFTRDPSAANEQLLSQFRGSSDPDAVAALVTADGSTIASNPPGRAIDPAVLEPFWSQALTGQAVGADVIRYRGTVVSPTLVPVGATSPWAVVVMLRPGPGSASQTFVEQIGSLNDRPGGMAYVDRQGVAFTSWWRDEVGQAVVTPDERAALSPGTTRQWTHQRNGQSWTVFGRDLGSGHALLFEQRTDDLFADLRDAQHRRDVTLVAEVVAAVAALAFFQGAREVATRRAAARAETLLRNSHDLVLVVDGRGDLTFVSPNIEAILGHPAGAWPGRPVTALCHPDDAPGLTRLIRGQDAGPLLNVRLRTGEGAGESHRWFDVEARNLLDHPEVAGVLLTGHAVGRRKQLQDELDHQATHDPLTGLPNRARLTEELERRLHDGRPVEPFAVLYLDLDDFKAINDALGHDAGDEVLITVAHRLQSACGPDTFLCRFGGDELVAVVGAADRAMAIERAEALRDAVRAPTAVRSRLRHLDASIGIALADPGTPLANPEQLIRHADRAMYDAKKRGRGRWSVAPGPAPTTDAHPATVVERSTATPAAAPTPAPTPPARPAAVERHRRRPAAPLPTVVTVGLLAAIAVLGFAQSADAQRSAETEKVARNRAFAARAADFYSSVNDPAKLVPVASGAPWTLTGSATDAAVVKAFATSPSAGVDATAILATPDGRRLASYPPGTELSITPDSPAWRDAVDHARGHQVPAVADPDQPRSYFVVPVVRDGRPVAVLALGLSNRVGPQHVALEQAGATSDSSGGWSMVGADGVVFESWDQGLVGTHLVDPDQLAGLRPGDARDLSTDDRVTLVAPKASTLYPTYLTFDMPRAAFFADLRSGQRPRDIGLLALVAAAIGGLAVVNQRRGRSARRDRAHLDALLEQAHDVIVVLGADDRVTFVSSAVRRLLGDPAGEHVGHTLATRVHHEDRARLAALLGDARSRGIGEAADLRLLDADGRVRWFDADAVDLGADPAVRGILLTLHDVGERRALEEELAYRAVHDPLTGLPNRTTLGLELARLSGTGDGDAATLGAAEPFAVLFVDLDHFKPVNDTLGHDAGDEVLRIVARRLLANLRTDAGDLVCRLGGDEFAVVLRNTTEGVARATAERLIEVVREPIAIGAHTVHISATIGVSQSHHDRLSPDTVIRQADQAMYLAKDTGRGTYAVFPASGPGPSVD
jgi:diguanylate cyclase (GGDEF)-like protein/PAS domain S-box-containing protein